MHNIIIILETKKYDRIILPDDGFRTGLANLKINAQKILEYIDDKVEKLKVIVHNM